MQSGLSVPDRNPGAYFISQKKVGTLKSHRSSVLKSLIHIENNLDQPLPLKDLAHIACHSSYHFHRLFAFFMNETLNDYISRRRIEQAASQLFSSHRSITDIALSSGYGTPSSFAKTFKRLTDISPSRYREQECQGQTDSGLLDSVFLRGLRSARNTYLTDIEPVIREVPERYALTLRKRGFFDGSFSQAIYAGLRELFHYVTEAGISDQIGYPFTACQTGFPRSLDDPDAEIEIGLLLKRPLIPEEPFCFSVLKGGRYALYTYYEPARLYKLSWPVYWQWDRLLPAGSGQRKPYRMMLPSDKPALAVFKKMLHVPVSAFPAGCMGEEHP